MLLLATHLTRLEASLLALPHLAQRAQGLAKAVVAIIIAATSAAATSQKYLGVISQHQHQHQQQQQAKHCECGNSCWAGSEAGHDGDRGEWGVERGKVEVE